MINCSTATAQGRIETRKESLLNKKLIAAFPDRLNSEGGSLLYDKLFTDQFIQFYGDWSNKEEKWVNYYKDKDYLFDELGEPKLYYLNNEYFFTNPKQERYILNKRYLSEKDKIETVNSLSLLYASKPDKSISNFVNDTLNKRKEVLLSQYDSIESNIEDNEDFLSEDQIQDLEFQLFKLNNSIVAIEKDMLENNDIFNSIVLGIETKLADFNIKYIDEADNKEDEDPNTNDEISNFTKESSEVRDTNNIDIEIKSLLSSIEDYNIDINNIETPKLSDILNLPIARPANEVKNKIMNTISNIVELEMIGSNTVLDPYNLMIDKLTERQLENNDLIIRDFLNKLNILYNSKSEIDKEAFKTKFVTSFYKAQNIFTITEISEEKDKLILRHIDPSNSQDKEAFVSNEITRGLYNKFNYSNSKQDINNNENYKEAARLLRNFKSKNDIIKGLELLNINFNTKTINDLYKNRENVLKDITKLYPLTLKELFTSLFEQDIKYFNTDIKSDIKTSAKGLKMILQAYTSSNLATQKNISKELINKDNFTPISILSNYESKNRNDLGDLSYFVGSKQRWMLSLVSGINKEILNWQAGNIKSLLAKRNRNLLFVDYLLDLDSVKKGLYAENSPENIQERTKRISNIKLIINSEVKKVNDSSPIQHKEIGEADLHMDIFFKMFNHKDEIYEKIDKQQGISQQINNSNKSRVINNYSFSADKGGSYSIGGLLEMNTNVIVNESGDLVSLGLDNENIIKNYLLGEFNNMLEHSKLIEGYLNKKTRKSKQEYLMQYLIPDYHYVSKLNTGTETITFNAEDENQVLDYNLINAGTWNKFSFFNSVYNNHKDEFDVLFTNNQGVKLADSKMRSHITNTLYQLAINDIIDIAKDNKDYLDKIIIESNIQNNTKLFQKETNIIGSKTDEMQYSYIINSIFNNLEMFSLFNGELSFYKQKGNTISMEDALKRGPAILTDGLYIRQSNKQDIQEYITYNNKKESIDKNKESSIAILNVLENDKSKFSDQIKEATGNNNLTYAHEIADAQGFISLDFYKKVISGTYGWTENDEYIYSKLSDKNHKYTDKDIKWLKSAGRSMQALKLTGFNLENILNENGDIIGQQPVYLKYSTAVLAPAIIGGTDLEKLSNQMQKQNVDQVIFKSGSKASNKQATTIFNKEDGIFTGLKEDMVLNPFKFSLGGLKLQVELPTKFDKDGVLGNQHLKNLLANLDLNNPDKIYKFRGQKLSARELYNEYDKTIKNILQFQLNEFADKININDSNNILDFDETKLRELIVGQLDINADGDLIDIISDTSLPLESIPGIAQRAFPIISGYIHKNVGKVITNAGSAIQVANIGFDRISDEDSNNVIYLSEDKELRPPLPITNEKGEILYFAEDGTSSTDKTKGRMEIQKARIMLPFSSIYDKTGLSYEQLKKAIAENKIDKEIFRNVIGYRIPNQSISSNDSMEIVGILPPNMGDTAIVYHEITAKTGSDFDIDKMYLMMPNFKLNKDNSVNYIIDAEQDTNITSKGQQNKLIELMGSILSNQNTYDDLISPLDSDIPKEAINEVLYIKSIINTEDYETKLKEFRSLKDEKKSKFLKSFGDQRKLSPLQQLAPVAMVRSRVDMLQAKKLVATMANHMTDIPMSQIVNQTIKYDLGIDSFEFNNIFTKGYENNNEYKLTKIVSYLMNAAVDAAKDNYIIEGNFNSYTANGAMVMIRMGIDPVNVFKVLLNEDILRLSKLKQLQTQKISNINTDDYSQELLNTYSRNLVNHLQTNKIDFNNFINTNEDFNNNLILGFWNIIQLAGKELNNDIVSSKSDSNGAGKNIYEHHVLYNRLERLNKESIGSNINDNFVRGLKLFKNGLDTNNLDFKLDLDDNYTFLGAMMNNSLFLTNFITKKMFIENTDNYRYVVNRISNQLGESLPTSSDNIKTISNYLYPFILSQSGHKLYNIDESQVDYLQKEFLNEVINKKALNPDNYFLKEVYIDPNTNLISFPNFKYYDTNSKTLLKESLERLYNQKDNKGVLTGPLFINKLVKYAFLTTGFKPTFFCMNEYLPKSYFLNTGHGYYINNLINRLNNSSEFIEDEFIQKAMTFMAINNETNYKIVGNLYKADGLNSNQAVSNKQTLAKVTVKNTNNFYPFIRMKQSGALYLLSDIINNQPVYNLINSNSEEVDTESNNNLKRKTKVKLFDLNTIKPENLFKGDYTNNSLYIQPEIEYVSELSSIFEDNNWTVGNDSVSLQDNNILESNNMNNTDKELKKIKIILQPHNIDKILSGNKSTTIRKTEQTGLNIGESGLLILRGNNYIITNRGYLNILEAGGKDKIISSEGLQNESEFMFKQSKDWVNGKDKMYVYDITPLSNETYGLNQEEWNNLTIEEQTRIKECN